MTAPWENWNLRERANCTSDAPAHLGKVAAPALSSEPALPMTRTRTNPERFWAQVTAFGALWGAFEVTLGAFLMSLRIPFTGAVLASVSAALLVAERQLLPARGVSLATAAVAALCKSISPGGVILGPMIGILLEGLLVEIALLLRPRSLPLALLAGSACALTTIGQRLLMSYLFYGASVIDLYVQLISQAGVWLGLGGTAGWFALAIFLGIIAALGAAGGLLGHRIGRSVERVPSRDPLTDTGSATPLSETTALPDGSERQRVCRDQSHPRVQASKRLAPRRFPKEVDAEVLLQAPPALGRRRDLVQRTRQRLLGGLAVLAVALQFGGRLWLSSLALLLWLLALLAVDRPILQRLWMPRFWLFTLLFAGLSGLLLGQRDLDVLGLSLSRTGLEAGCLMVVRGAFIFSLMTWLSRALTGEGLERFFRRIGAGRLGVSVAVALTLIPSMKERFQASRARGAAESGSVLGRVYRAMLGMVTLTARLAQEMSRPREILQLAVIAPPGAGKTSFLLEAVARLQAAGVRVGGVCQPKLMADGQRLGYELLDVQSGERRPFIRVVRPDEAGPGCCEFLPDGWAWARERLLAARCRDDVVVCDELGRLEARGQGYISALRAPVLEERAAVRLVTIRAEHSEAIQARIGATEAAPPTIESLIERIWDHVQRQEGRRHAIENDVLCSGVLARDPERGL